MRRVGARVPATRPALDHALSECIYERVMDLDQGTHASTYSDGNKACHDSQNLLHIVPIVPSVNAIIMSHVFPRLLHLPIVTVSSHFNGYSGNMW